MSEIRKKIEARTQKNFFTEMMFLANTTGVDQKEYIKNIIDLAELLEGYLRQRDLINLQVKLKYLQIMVNGFQMLKS